MEIKPAKNCRHNAYVSRLVIRLRQASSYFTYKATPHNDIKMPVYATGEVLAKKGQEKLPASYYLCTTGCYSQSDAIPHISEATEYGHPSQNHQAGL